MVERATTRQIADQWLGEEDEPVIILSVFHHIRALNFFHTVHNSCFLWLRITVIFVWTCAETAALGSRMVITCPFPTGQRISPYCLSNYGNYCSAVTTPFSRFKSHRTCVGYDREETVHFAWTLSATVNPRNLGCLERGALSGYWPSHFVGLLQGCTQLECRKNIFFSITY